MTDSGPHRIINPPDLPEPRGYSHVVLAEGGRTVFLAGQAAPEAGEGLTDQFAGAVAKLVEALQAAGGRPEHLVWLQIFVTDAADYRELLGPLGRIYRHHFGRHYPAMGLFEVKGLFDPQARVELMGIAVLPA